MPLGCLFSIQKAAFFVFKGKLSLLLFLLFIKALLVGLIIPFVGIGLGPDEAQYWTWSKELSWGYYSKPPGIAWQIWVGTQIFGDSELGVRFGSLVLGSFLPLAVFYLAKATQLTEETAFWAALIMAFTPLGFLATFFAITDVGVVLFWVLSLIPLIKSIEDNTKPNAVLIGILIACGALFKWQIYWIWLLIFSLLFFIPILRNWSLFITFLLSLIGLLPSLYWNMTHEWATFRHVGSTMQGPEGALLKGNFLDFFGAQTALVSPIIFIMLLISFRKLKNSKISLRVLGGSCLAILILHCVLAIFKKVQGNWCDYAYPAGFVFLAWACKEEHNLKWLKAGLLLSIILVVSAFSLPYLQQRFQLSFKLNPFRHNVGWQKLERLLPEIGFEPKEDFLFASSYQTVSLLSFYNEQQGRAYFFNLHGIRKNQFSFWPQMAEEVRNKVGYYFVIENGRNVEQRLGNETPFYQKKLAPYFREVHCLGIFPLCQVQDEGWKAVLVFKCIQYNGSSPYFKNKY
ncbi:Uncharacterized protein PHSC3_001612 [Chlamydiales bacterium STE3]|nr:Uncharacterized protein PHSC3_001612 [Chlamydiales bacterium STE3]